MSYNPRGKIHNPETAGNRRSRLEQRNASPWLFLVVVMTDVHDVLRLSWAVSYVLRGLLSALNNPQSTSPLTTDTQLSHLHFLIL